MPVLRLLAAISCIVLLGCAVDDPVVPPPAESPTTTEQPVVYGADDRLDWYAHPDEDLRDLTSEAIVALIGPGSLDQSNPENIRITSGPIGPSRGLCEDERFYDQPRAAFCSGTLIDSDLVLTAGHCIDDLADCQSRRYVFNYLYETEGELATITADDVYECAELLARRLDSGVDYAILRLDRPVPAPRAPAIVRTDLRPMEDGESVTIIGFGSGLPAKIDNGGVVVDPRADSLDFFNATTDAFGGNSGSGVFDANEEVVGILVRGATDYVDDGGCTRVNVLPEDSDGEDIVYAALAVEELCASGYDSVLCSGTGGYCRPCDTVEDCNEGFICADPGEGAGVAICTSECGEDADCRDDFVCNDAGVCAPELRQRCFGGDPWTYNACGARLEVLATCGDGEICEDGACAEAGAGNQCDAPVVLEAVDQTLEATLAGLYTDEVEGSCGGAGVDRVYSFTLEEAQRLRATVTGFDTVLHLRRSCEGPDTEEACDDDSNPPGGRGSRIDVSLDPGTWYLFVDAFGQNAGDFELDLRFSPNCECSVGDTRCLGSGVQTCADVGGACPEWNIVASCGEDETCFGGECGPQEAGDICADAIEIPAQTARYDGDLSSGYGDDLRGTCGGDGYEVLYTFTVDEETTLRAAVTGFDSVLYLRTPCDNPTPAGELACNDDTRAGVERGSSFEVDVPAGTYFLIVDAFSRESAGAYDLDLEFDRACVDQCDAEGELRCTSPTTYRVCGQFDDDACLDLAEEETCIGTLRCSEREQECVDPNATGSPDVGGADAGDASTDTISEVDTGEGAARSGNGSGGGCAVAPRSTPPALWWSALVALVWLRRRR